MTQFEFFMAFYGLLLGLALAELLSGFGKLLRQRVRPDWGILTPLAGVVVFVSIVTAFSDAWSSMQNVSISFRSFMAPIGIGISLFLGALMVVPQDVAEWGSLDIYFRARRRFIFGPLIAYSLILDFALELPKSLPKGGPSAVYIVVNSIILVLLTIPAVARRTSTIVSSMIAFLALMVLIYFSGETVQQQFESLFGVTASPPLAASRPSPI